MVITTPHRSIDRYAFTGDEHSRAFRVNRFDRVTSMLTALTLLMGVLVGMLFLLWCLSPGREIATVVEPPRVISGTPIRSTIDEAFLVPESIEVVDLAEPSIQQSIVAVTAASSTVAAGEWRSLADSGSVESTGQPKSDGDFQAVGAAGNADEVPRFQRWQLQFEAADVKTYARQLDQFGITLGFVQTARTQLLTGMSTSSPNLSDRGNDAAKQLYFAWARPSPLEQFDRQLFRSAGVSAIDGKMVKFIPASLEDHLAVLELAYATTQGRVSADQIAKTVFTAQRRGQHFEFAVSYQRYRTPKP